MSDIIVTPSGQQGVAASEPATLEILNRYEYNTTLVASDTAKKVVLKKKLSQWVPEGFSMSGILELEEVVINYLPYGADAWLNCGFAPECASIKTSTLGLGPGGHSSNFTQLRPGAKYSVTLKVPARLSNRMQGTPTQGMPAQFCLTASLNMKVIVTRKMLLHGVQVVYEDLKC